MIAALESISLDDLIELMGYKKKDRFRSDYIKPLRENDLIEYTIKEKPNDPNQKYLIAEKGKMFLGGFDI